MPDLTLVGLSIVREVARTGSFSAAAELLGYTQSAVSRQVATMERAAGGPLFERHARGVRPTAAGDALVRHAVRMLESLGAANNELAGMRDRLAGRLVIGGFPTAAAAIVPGAVARLRHAHPGIEVQLMEGSTPTQIRALRRGRLEVAVVATGDGLPEYDVEALRLTELRSERGAGVAVAETHPFVGRARIDPGDLVDEDWVVGASVGGSPEFGAWPGIEQPRISFAARDWQTRLGFVAAGLGIAMVPGFAAGALPLGVHWIPVHTPDAGLGRQMWAVTDADPGAAARAMVRSLEDQVSDAPAPR